MGLGFRGLGACGWCLDLLGVRFFWGLRVAETVADTLPGSGYYR